MSDPIGDALRARNAFAYKLADVNDAGPNALHMTNVNAVTFGAGQVGNAGYFVAASSQELTHAADALYELSAPCMFSAWVYFAAHPAVNGCILSYRNGGTRYSFYLSAVGSFGIWNGTSAGTDGQVNATGQWLHWLATCEGTDTQFYVNGVASGAPVAIVPSATTGLTFNIGGINGGEFWDGRIDEVYGFSGATSADDIAYLYALGLAGRSLY